MLLLARVSTCRPSWFQFPIAVLEPSDGGAHLRALLRAGRQKPHTRQPEVVHLQAGAVQTIAVDGCMLFASRRMTIQICEKGRAVYTKGKIDVLSGVLNDGHAITASDMEKTARL